MNGWRMVIVTSGAMCAAALAGSCTDSSFPTTPAPVATAAVVQQGSRYEGSLTMSSGATTSFNMTLIARGLSGQMTVTVVQATGPLSVTGNFATGSGVSGTIEGTLTGSLENGFFTGSLIATTSGGHVEQQYSGPITTTGAAWVPGTCLQGTCAADGIAGYVQAVQATAGSPPPSCSYALSPTTASFAEGGGTGGATITTASNCTWSVLSTVSWITIAGANTGTGTGAFTFDVQANPGDQRMGSLKAAGQTLNATQAAHTVTGVAPALVTQPQSQTVTAGSSVVLSVEATGPSPLSYQWYLGASGTTTSPIAGATASSYTTPALSTTSSYWVRVANASGSVNSITVTITVSSTQQPPAITTQPQSQVVASGASVVLSVAATGSSPLTYQWYLGPAGTTNAPIAGATASSYTTPPLTATSSYWVRISNAAGSVNSAAATVSVNSQPQPPTITAQPQSQTIASGGTATLSVTATGTAPLRYQWYVGGSGSTINPIQGATGTSYAAQPRASTSYWVRVSDSNGNTDSATATITVNFLLVVSYRIAPQCQPYSIAYSPGSTCTIQGDPLGVGSCNQVPYPSGTVVRLTASGPGTPGWSGCDAASGSVCTVTMNSDRCTGCALPAVQLSLGCPQ